jgi:hypothetical protein
VVRDDPGFDLWEDTTTLRVQLHKGKDKTGPVAGAGVLKLSKAELFNLLRTLHAIDARDAAEKFNLIANFGSFFLGELWDSYKGIINKSTDKKGKIRYYAKLLGIAVAIAAAGSLGYLFFFG